MSTAQFSDLFRRLFTAEGQSRTARTVELFGWLIFVESASLLFFRISSRRCCIFLRSPPLAEQGANYLRLVGVLVGGRR